MFPDGFDAGIFDSGVFDTASSAAVAAVAQSGGAHGRKRASDLAAFLATIEAHKETPDERPDEPTPRKRPPIRLPAIEFAALPERFQLPVMDSFAELIELAAVERMASERAQRIAADKARRLQAAIREAIRRAQEEDDEDVILALAA